MTNNEDVKLKTSPAAQVGQALCGMVHDISNVVQTVLLRAEVMMVGQGIAQEDIKELEHIISDSKKNADTLKCLLEHARKEITSMEPVDIRDAVAQGVALADSAIEAGQVALAPSPSPVTAVADPEQLEQLVALLALELLRDAGPETKVTVALNTNCNVGDEPSEDKAAAPKGADEGKSPAPTICFKRIGKGAPLTIEDGLLALPTGEEVEEHQLNMLRAKGIVRQHRGRFEILEAVDDKGEELALQITLGK